MTIETISLDAIKNRVFEIRQQTRDQLDPILRQEIKEYQQSHLKPSVPFFAFNNTKEKARKALKKYEEDLETIINKHNNHPLVQEWAKLQEQCPHNYDKWEELDGPSEIRICSVCYKKQQRWNFQF